METSGANLLPEQFGLPRHPQPAVGPDPETTTPSRWWQKLPDEIARKTRKNDQALYLREVDHLEAHPDIPFNLIEALQRGTDRDDQPTSTAVTIDGQSVHVAVSPRGTGIPEPDSQGVWDALCATYRDVSASPYCADIVLPLPQEIAAIRWTTPAGQTVNITPCRPQRLRAILSVALVPLARMGELGMSATTGSAAAALALGASSLSPVPVPIAEEPTPDLRPKTGSIAQRLLQADRTTRPAPGKVRIRVRHTTLSTVSASALPRTPRPAATSAAPLTSAKPDSGPAPREQLSASPEPAPHATPAVAVKVSPTPSERPRGGSKDWTTLLPSALPSILKVDPT